MRRIPKCLRSITLVKVGGDLTKSKIRGAVAPDEILAGSSFIDADPTEGFSVRNFHIQAAKLAAISDIIVYGDDDVSEESILSVAVDISTAQEEWMRRYDPGQESRLFNTFVVSTSFQEIEEQHPNIVAINQNGAISGQVMDFFLWERLEMYSMSQASEISNNVWQGPTPDLSYDMGGLPAADYDILIETHDGASIPDSRYLTKISSQLHKGPHHIEFPSSGSIMASAWSQLEVYDFIATCRWIYQLANPISQDEPSEGEDGDIPMRTVPAKPRKVFIHCGDGYTESSLLALAYFMYAEGAPVHEAWLRLHCEKKRNFFAYPSDVTFLLGIQQKLLCESPNPKGRQLTYRPSPNWMTKMDGSLPSRILPYMYLGNLAHATNPELLWSLGIRRVLSVGEPVSWMAEEVEKWGAENLLLINEVQDNGIDPLTQELERCLEFIENGKLQGTATLVHCRVGVSRSATICIAEVMKSMNLSFPRAYLAFVVVSFERED
ncbi:pps1 dual specificity phosphatase [Arthroderma uncinatum]|uniref:pps1 dual specificity phosphatase n=1 Tax=Arthroderma uncinatum TaxID=74035 RepID=UPI00144AA708|nr:pps1 dual specificity phosphatase [Arthroderma uncinatum]KAF3483175.1 pps1 dual specificity phosphatase [Arthroderma uncinatum]